MGRPGRGGPVVVGDSAIDTPVPADLLWHQIPFFSSPTSRGRPCLRLNGTTRSNIWHG